MQHPTTTAVPTAYVLRAARWIGRLAYTIAAVGTVASYGTQVGLLLAHDVGRFAYILPATVDILAICASLALHLPGLDTVSRRIAGAILLAAVSVSIAANLTGGHDVVSSSAHAWPVVAYLLAELLANRVRSYAAKLEAAEAARLAVAQAVTAPPVTVAPVAPVAVVAQAVAPVAAPVVRQARVVRPTSSTAGQPVNPRTGAPYSTRHLRRLAAAAAVAVAP